MSEEDNGEEVPGLTEPSEQVDIEGHFEGFLRANPYSAFTAIRPSEGETGAPSALIAKPWGDPSLAFLIPSDFEAIAEVLNVIVLPERLSAIWHSDTRRLEIIWTARKLPAIWQPVIGRKFQFIFRGTNHECEFSQSSERLMCLARLFYPLSTTTTGFRNMQSFAAYSDQLETEKDMSYDIPKSFWISNIDWCAEATIELLQHLNFYLMYYDNQSPHVIIHDVSSDKIEVAQRTRYIAHNFPTEIQAADIDQNLLTFWGAAPQTNQIMQFIIYYRMIEYCAMQYVDYSIRSELQRILSAPDIRSNISNVMDSSIAAINKKNLDDPAKLKAVIRNNVDPRHIWMDVKENIAFFSQGHEFDGGFKIRALIGASEVEDAFCSRGLEQFGDTLRRIRNALSHGKDQETDGVILPTQRNMELLRPWVHLIATTASDVALYKDVT